MLLTNAEGTLYDVPDDILSGLKLSNWVGHKDEISALSQSLMGVVSKMRKFSDYNSERPTLGCCGGADSLCHHNY